MRSTALLHGRSPAKEPFQVSKLNYCYAELSPGVWGSRSQYCGGHRRSLSQMALRCGVVFLCRDGALFRGERIGRDQHWLARGRRRGPLADARFRREVTLARDLVTIQPDLFAGKLPGIPAEMALRPGGCVL